MTLPNFLGIGAPRAGTTWLHELLDSHPDVFTPTVRKEINFFDHYFDRGVDWYERFFPSAEQSAEYRAIGEISPQYLEREECPERIFATLPDVKLIAILRHPVARAHSQYGLFVQRRNYKGCFEDFLAAKPRSLERGFYGRNLKRYLRFFDRAQILVLVFEQAVRDIDATKQRLADFLGIAVDKFPAAAGRDRVHASTIPRFQFLYGLVANTGRRLRKWHLEPVVDLVTRTGIPQILGQGDSLPPLDPQLKQKLARLYRDDFAELERSMQIDLGCWREHGQDYRMFPRRPARLPEAADARQPPP